MSHKMKCPHCGYKQDLTDYLADGYLEDDEHECSECGKTFEFLIEFDPVIYVEGEYQWS